MRVSTNAAWGEPPANAKTSAPVAMGSASIALWARYSFGARKQALVNRLKHH